MIKIEEKSKCCGCWACKNVCPVQCITMKVDEEGFRYPHVDKDKCINCHLCEKACPELKPEYNDDAPLKSYAIQQKDNEILRESTSGGFYSALSAYVIKNGGVVFGAAFDENMVLRHQYAETLEDCAKFRGSKYVQSLIGDTYSQALQFLKDGRLVAFSGTPCQIAGLYGFLRKRKFDNLVTVDLVCHGIPSPRLLKKYFDQAADKYQSKVTDYRSRDKYYGYQFSTATITFTDKDKEYHKGMEADHMLRLYFKNLISRPSCYDCHYKTINRISDITIFDCWDAQNISKVFNANGATNVFIHTSNGEHFFEEIKNDFKFAPTDYRKIVATDGVMIKKCPPLNPKRTQFFKDLNNLPLEEVEHIYDPISPLQKILISIKPAMYRLGIFRIYMKIKRIGK